MLIAFNVFYSIYTVSMFGIRSSDKNSIIHEDGLADTLHNILLHDNYVKPWSDEYSMVKLLTRSF